MCIRDRYVRQVLKRFMTRAYRRPATGEEVDRFAQIYKVVRPQLPSFEAAMRETLAMVLVSPQFMYVAASTSLDFRQHELASRLSYFLWVTMPASELTQVAQASGLDSEASIKTQVLRLLEHHARVEQSLRNLTMQWFSLSKLSTVPINRELFPRFLYYVCLLYTSDAADE